MNHFTFYNLQFTTNYQLPTPNCQLVVESLLNVGSSELKDMSGDRR